MVHHRTPLFTALTEHAKRNPIPFHIPGHKKGEGMENGFKTFLGDNALSIDLINIAPLDDLHQPTGVIDEAQRLAAYAFGADYSLFSVQGTSTAIMTMIMSVCGPGDKIIVPRNLHKSILSAIIFAGAKPIFVAPERDADLGIDHGISVRSVKKAIERHPDAKAVLVINPTYFGVCTNLKAIVDLAHHYGIPVLVDEAHGALLHFHDKLPLSAMQAGADLAATSMHKLGGSLTQSSLLHIKKGIVQPEKVQAMFSMLTTTSTSYILLASLDAARKQLALQGCEMSSKAIRLAEYARNRINEIPGLSSFGREILWTDAAFDFDPTKLTVHVRELGITGYDAEQWLRDHYNIEVELSDLYNILCLITPGDSKEAIDCLLNALAELANEHYKQQADLQAVDVKLPEIPQLALTPRDAFYGDVELIPIAQSAGRIIAESIYVYPPGIPILLPGEVIAEQHIRYILEHLEVGLPVKGPEDLTVQNVKVVVEVKAIF
ncbi:aminotransferase class I/II-fold pyridoxal phosphate-dependent enzyme [Paenibacillus lentus]|uniref:Aminotransferase class I/II-fold pyridoxal phosphate-dependent enzyme n=1 Tax=Paenibacillus lentus TaxID=1338368 RepID=A0A3S8RQ57_9BACL|nr:aminotransferase class I/II-fold pyridoxal phosphate-dependent enzyme [Paenibacillus lentus]AZK45096.1 aminotransferase class I/II-fold pyridoxal phosphate-dependent enzyme [Paenibacillus lentus]